MGTLGPMYLINGYWDPLGKAQNGPPNTSHNIISGNRNLEIRGLGALAPPTCPLRNPKGHPIEARRRNPTEAIRPLTEVNEGCGETGEWASRVGLQRLKGLKGW